MRCILCLKCLVCKELRGNCGANLDQAYLRTLIKISHRSHSSFLLIKLLYIGRIVCEYFGQLPTLTSTPDHQRTTWSPACHHPRSPSRSCRLSTSPRRMKAGGPSTVRLRFLKQWFPRRDIGPRGGPNAHPKGRNEVEHSQRSGELWGRALVAQSSRRGN
jgi:hypothetical protein